MIKKLLGALLCGAAVFSMGFLSSCKTDVSDLDERMRIIEAHWADIQKVLHKAVLDGLYMHVGESGYNEDQSKYTVALSNGHKVEIPLGTGTKVSVEIKEGVATITVDGEAYNIPLGSPVSSFVFVDEYGDRTVKMGNSGANVKFLVTPAISAEALAKATFDFADIMTFKTRVGATGEFVINGAAKIENGYVVVPIKGITCEAGKKYGVSAQMSVSGTTLSSDYFVVQVQNDFSFKAFDIDTNIKPIAALNATLNESDNTYSVEMSGEDFLDKDVDMAAWFTGVPAGAVFKAAAASSQPKGPARDKATMLAQSITSAGVFHFATRPGTVFQNDGEIIPAVPAVADDSATEDVDESVAAVPAVTRKGFAIDVTVDYITKARIYVRLIDPVTNTNWKAGFDDFLNKEGNGETVDAEWGARWKFITATENRVINFPATLMSIGNDPGDNVGTADWEIIHRGRTEFFDKLTSYKVSNEGKTIIEHNGEKIAMTAEGDRLAVKSEGFYWFIKGFNVLTPDCNDAGENQAAWDAFKYTKKDGSVVEGRGKTIVDQGGPQPGDNDWTPAPNSYYTTAHVAKHGITIDKDGTIRFADSFGNYGLRLTIGTAYQWYYGEKRIAPNGNELGFFFFNRRARVAVNTVTFPDPQSL